jgi:hypothetical protein
MSVKRKQLAASFKVQVDLPAQQGERTVGELAGHFASSPR